MNRALIVHRVMKDAKVSRRKAEAALDTLIASVGSACRKIGEVKFGGLGTFVALPSASRVAAMKKITAGTAQARKTSRGITFRRSTRPRLQKGIFPAGELHSEPMFEIPGAPVFLPNDSIKDKN